MFPDALTRFSSRVAHYVRFRPGYPAEIANIFRLCKGAPVVDIGSGTGLLSRVFLNAGYSVTGVEPNREMREAGESELAEFAKFRSVDGRAEQTTLPDSCCELVMAGQAFHWFDVDATRREWQRILKPGGRAALIWNDRLNEAEFMREVEDLIGVYAAERDPDGSIRERARGRIEVFFARHPMQIAKFRHSQKFDFEGLLGRLLSSSYLPPEDEAGELKVALRSVFDRHQRDGVVSFDYETTVYWGEL